MLRPLSLGLLCALAVGCAPGKTARAVDPAQDSAAEAALDGKSDTLTIPVGDYEQDPQYLTAMDLYNTEFMYLTVYANNGYVRSRCTSDGCATPVGEQGSFKLTRTASGTSYVRFSGRPVDKPAASTLLDRYAFELDGTTVWLRKARTSDWFPMVRVASLWSESLCDDTKGGWTDDDLSPAGTYCVCGAGRVWLAESGCVAVKN